MPATRRVAATSVLILLGALVLPAVTAGAAVAPVGQGFTVSPADLAFILKQIKIAEAHVAGTTSATGPCGALVGSGPNQVPNALSAYGLRTVDGSCNNLTQGNEKFGGADQPFPRYASPSFRDAEPITSTLPVGPPGPTSYKQLSGSVVDSQPRMISNLIVDQSATNPAAVAAAGFPVRSQPGATGVVPCTKDPAVGPPATAGIPAGCVPSGQTLNIPNVTTDIGLSPPYNSLFTFFGQFFDHGLDQTVKGGGTVFVPLKADDPLIIGPDGIAGTADDPKLGDANYLPPSRRFMVLTRAQNLPGPDGILGTADDIQNASNTDTPWVDQSQTYTSHPSHQVFLRQYVNDTTGRPISTGLLLGGLGAGLTYAGSPDGTTGMATWAAVKAQSLSLLGIRLVDKDVLNVPMIATDPYGKFIPGPARGLPQYVTKSHGLVEADRGLSVDGLAGTPVPADVLHMDTPFLTDIAHNADPSPDPQTGVSPVPDGTSTPLADFTSQLPGTYNAPMLNAHFICGDGRCNENIALSAIHQIFHSEHERLVGAIEDTLSADTSPTGVAALAEWKLADGAPGAGTGSWNGERIFQAARFVNEMEYQHLVFEEFARKVQPAIQPFSAYHSNINPAIHAEFAHAVYRFGHSMLDDVVARTNESLPGPDGVLGTRDDIIGSNNDIPLLKGFLNPPEYFNGGTTAGVLTPQQAAGSVVMGSSDQVGNELDEFVNNTLRNSLLGLPLDLATLNITRAREAGVPPLNVFRKSVFATTGDGQLQPYTSWADFGQNLKHPESLINFVAAYGQYPSILASTSTAGKRAAATAIVTPPIGSSQTADQLAFMNSSGAWANTAAGVSITGLDDVDLWVGGLAEKTNPFGGLLGSTFNYVFENQLTDLQNGDRLYYVARTAGLNLGQQLEGNSFAELIMRNTEGTNTLKADAFATADCKFQLGTLDGTPAGFTASGPSVADDPNTGCNENALLLRKPDGTIQYQATNTVNHPGINFQTVFNGTPNADRVVGGNDNDTIYGNLGNDVINGGGGDDTVFGGDGNDIITDTAGLDVLKGGSGNDAIDGGIGNDIIFGGDGQDFTSGGANDNTTFGGQGNDFIRAGDGNDVAAGDSGDDWIQGGSGTDLLKGDHGAPFMDDPGQVTPGNDVLIGQAGDNSYVAEGGDDIMASSSGIDLNSGGAGWDWGVSQFDTTAANADLNLTLAPLPIPGALSSDKFQETEALSGWNLNDHLVGDSVVPSSLGGAGSSGCDALDQAGLDRITGLAALMPALINKVAGSVPGIHCPLSGPIWGEGNILLGGSGSDTIEGRGGNDIIDGDSALQVRISVRDHNNHAIEIGSSDLMEHQYLHTGAILQPSGVLDSSNLTGPTLQEAVFNGTVDPGDLVTTREIVHPVDPSAVDTAVFSGPQANYDVTTVPVGAALGSPGSVTTVKDVVGADGTDTLRNVEVLQFGGATTPPVTATTPGGPTAVSALGGPAQATLVWTAPDVQHAGPQVVTGYQVEVDEAVTGAIVGALHPAGPAANSLKVTGLAPGSYRLRVQAVNSAATPPGGPFSVLSNAVTVTPAVVPGAPVIGTATGGDSSAVVSWAAPATDGGSAVTGYAVRAVDATTSAQIGALQTAAADATSATLGGLVNGVAVVFQVQAINAVGPGGFSALSNSVTPATVPAAPRIGAVTRGSTTALVTWAAPATDGGSAVTGYAVRAVDATTSAQIGALQTAAADATSATLGGLVNGVAVVFQVQAINAVGPGGFSALSNSVTPATVPAAPRIGAVTRGSTTALVTWAAPASDGGSAVTGYSVKVVNASSGLQVGVVRPTAAGATRLTLTGLINGFAVRFQVQAANAMGSSAYSTPSNAVTPATLAGAPTIGAAARGNASALVRWAAPVSNGGSVVTGYSVRVVNAAGQQVGALRLAGAGARSLTVTGLVNGAPVRFQVRAGNAVGTGLFSARSNPVTPARAPSAPLIQTSWSGVARGPVNAVARWSPPVSNGGLVINGYVVTAYRLNAAGKVVLTVTSAVQAPSLRSLRMSLPPGSYRFVVQARNVVGLGARSARSNLVSAR
ncbi:MAG: peroxidase family protein [Propionicimonas sp.]